MSAQPDDKRNAESDTKDDREQASTAEDQKSNDSDPSVDPKTQYAGVTIDPDHPNDEG